MSSLARHWASSGADSKFCEYVPFNLFFNFLVPSPVGQWYALDWGRGGEIVAPQLVAIPNMVTTLKLHMLAQPALGRHALFIYSLKSVPLTLYNLNICIVK